MKKTLPISDRYEEIVTAVRDNPVVIITAETGAGKSTQVPQYLLAEGYDLVVTQPRRLRLALRQTQTSLCLFESPAIETIRLLPLTHENTPHFSGVLSWLSVPV
jgi:predicted GTPase